MSRLLPRKSFRQGHWCLCVISVAVVQLGVGKTWPVLYSFILVWHIEKNGQSGQNNSVDRLRIGISQEKTFFSWIFLVQIGSGIRAQQAPWRCRLSRIGLLIRSLETIWMAASQFLQEMMLRDCPLHQLYQCHETHHSEARAQRSLSKWKQSRAHLNLGDYPQCAVSEHADSGALTRICSMQASIRILRCWHGIWDASFRQQHQGG